MESIFDCCYFCMQGKGSAIVLFVSLWKKSHKAIYKKLYNPETVGQLQLMCHLYNHAQIK